MLYILVFHIYFFLNLEILMKLKNHQYLLVHEKSPKKKSAISYFYLSVNLFLFLKKFLKIKQLIFKNLLII